MLPYSSSDVLSPRELRRQVFRYFLFSMLFWVFLTVLGAVFFIDLEVVPGKSLSLLLSPVLLAQFVWRIAVFSLLAGVFGAILAVPSAALVWMANAGTTFAIDERSVKGHVRWLSASFFPVLMCIVFHLGFLLVSFSASPIFASRLDGGDGFFWKPVSVIYDLVYEDPASEIAKNWRKVFAENDTSLLVVMLPERVLSKPGRLPLIEKEMGAPIPYFVGAPNLPWQLKRILTSQSDLQPVDGVLFANEDLLPETSKNQAQLLLAPEYQQLQNKQRQEISQTLFLSQRFGLTQAHLSLWGRAGFWGALFDGMSWGDVDADDGYRLSQFLSEAHKKPQARVRVLQLSALGSFDGLGGIRPRRYSMGGLAEIENSATRTLDLKLGRMLGALRQNRKLSIVIMPYAERLNSNNFSHIFARVAEGVSNPFVVGNMVGKTFASAADIASLHLANSEKKLVTPLVGAYRCEFTQVAPEFLSGGANEIKSDIMASAYAYVKPNSRNVLHVSPESRSLGADLFHAAAFCTDRTTNSNPDKLVLWRGEKGIEISEAKLPVLSESVVAFRAATTSTKGQPLRGKTKARELVAAGNQLPSLALNGRLFVYSLSPKSGATADASGGQFVEAYAPLLRSLFYNSTTTGVSQ